jgi:Icc-related predicted phosphoesterase
VQLLLVSDLHYTLPHFDWVLDQAADFDAVVLAGDHLDLGSAVPMESQIVVVRTYVQKLAEQTSVLVCSGNHDLTGRNAHGEKSAPWIEQASSADATVDWGTFDHDDVRVTVCPWWDGPSTRIDVDRQLARDAENRPRLWMWIYHYPPDEAAVSWTGKGHIGDTELNSWIDRHHPDLVLTGHIHDSPFREGGSWSARLGATWVLNAGRMPGPIPAHVIVDSTEGTAQWWSPYGRGDEQLWPALAS